MNVLNAYWVAGTFYLPQKKKISLNLKGHVHLLILHKYSLSEAFSLIFVLLQAIILNYMDSLEHDFSCSFSLLDRPYRE